MVVIVEGVEIGRRCWNVGASPPVGSTNTKTILNGRKRRGCVTFNPLMTLHFNTCEKNQEEQRYHTQEEELHTQSRKKGGGDHLCGRGEQALPGMSSRSTAFRRGAHQVQLAQSSSEAQGTSRSTAPCRRPVGPVPDWDWTALGPCTQHPGPDFHQSQSKSETLWSVHALKSEKQRQSESPPNPDAAAECPSRDSQTLRCCPDPACSTGAGTACFGSDPRSG